MHEFPGVLPGVLYYHGFSLPEKTKTEAKLKKGSEVNWIMQNGKLQVFLQFQKMRENRRKKSLRK